MSEDTQSPKRPKSNDGEESDADSIQIVSSPAKMPPAPEQSGPLELEPSADETMSTGDGGEEQREPDVDIVGEVNDEEDDDDEIIVMPPSTTSGDLLDESMRTPTKKANERIEDKTYKSTDGERVFSSFPCQVIPETLGRMTRTPPDGEHLMVHKNSNGRLRVFVIDHFSKYSLYSNLTHKPCTVCQRIMKAGEMHLNFPADLDRRRIWANLLGFKYKDILRSKMGPVSFSVAAGPICTEHFAEECFRNHNFNKSAIEAFGVPVAISPDVKTTPSKKRVPWVCTICEFHSCSVVELQAHLLEHTEDMLKNKESAMEVPEAGFMCPFCRKCTYGYKTISGYRRHLMAGPIHHCHLRRIYEFAKMNCRATELDPVDSWSNWTRRNVYVAYHGCEPPANEIVLTPSPTKKAYVQNPEERTKMVHDEERRKKAVRTLSFVGKEGGTSVNDLNVMQRQVYLQIRRERELAKKAEEAEGSKKRAGPEESEDEEDEEEEEESEDEDIVVEEEDIKPPPQLPMGSAEKKKSAKPSVSATSSPVKTTQKATSSAPPTPAKKRKTDPISEEPKEPTPAPADAEETEEQISPNDPRERLRQKIRDERFAEMVQKRSQQVTRLINAKQFKKGERSPIKPRKALQYTLMKGITMSSSSAANTSSVEPEEKSVSRETSPEPSTSSAPSTSRPAKRIIPPVTRSQRSGKKPTSYVAAPPPKKAKRGAAVAAAAAIAAKEPPEESTTSSSAPATNAPVEKPAEPEERPLKSKLARSLFAGLRPSLDQYRIPMEPFTRNPATAAVLPTSIATSSDSSSSGIIPTGAGTSRSISTGAIARPPAASSPGGMFSQRVMGAITQDKQPTKRPAVLARRPLILSPRKRAPTPRQSLQHHESSPSLTAPSAPSAPMTVPDEYIVSGKDMEVEMIEEVIDSVIAQSSSSGDSAGTSSSDHGGGRQLSLAEALELGGASNGETVKDQDLEEISKKMMEESQYYRAMEDAIKCRTVTKMRADMRLSRHCIRQIEAARARARLFGEGHEDYQIYYSNDGAQVLTKNDPKYRELQLQQQQQQASQPGPSDQ
ncbi:CRE-LIN-36 protein [Caenorhabditis remanei]|uniref:CRE-LIN-36 protein n=1 Tax=Caenorhabditis remanei TaxID=31234 RepID=E3MP12_CAERE|nr:CRE-LIN-36 protein [Caenorhabditis remanei]